MIRAATIEDADGVADVYIGSRRRHMAFAPPAHSDDEIRSWIRHVLIPRGGVLVIEHEGRIVAMMAVSSDEEGSWIDQLYVHPEELSQGFGAMLIAEAKKTLARPVQLYTFQDNHRSRRFYERHGFVAIEFRDGSGNEERCPDVRYRLEEKSLNQAVGPTAASGRGSL